MDAGTHVNPSVVVATDGSVAADAAVDWAAVEAASRHEPLVIVTACDPIPMPAASIADGVAVPSMSYWTQEVEELSEERHALVSKVAERVRAAHPDLEVRTEVYEGDPRPALEGVQKFASVIVMGSRGLGSVRSLLLGSVSFWATRHLRVPLVVVRPVETDSASEPEGIAVGIAWEANSERTLTEAFAMAQRRNATLTIANAAWDPEVTGERWAEIDAEDVDRQRRRTVEELAEQVSREFPEVTYKVLFARGQVDRFLASLGRTHEAVVLGRRTSTLLDFIGLGTLASAVVEHGVGAIMVIPVEGGR